VVKDRWDKIDGQQFDDPGFEDFLPHISRLALGGEHVGVRDTGDSRSILKTEKRDWQPVQRKIVLGEIEDLIVLHVPGQKAEEKQRKIQLIRDALRLRVGRGRGSDAARQAARRLRQAAPRAGKGAVEIRVAGA
jgi:hypothetical protein